MEVWLGLLLSGVKSTIHSIIRQAHMAIGDAGLKLLEFQSVFPAQVGLLGIQLIWTRDAEEALKLSKADKKVGEMFQICKVDQMEKGEVLQFNKGDRKVGVGVPIQ